jgi:large subunit ribosomal protein L19
VEVMRQGKVRRAKLYYLRGKKGKFAKVEDREFVASAKGQPGVTRKAEEPVGAASASKS